MANITFPTLYDRDETNFMHLGLGSLSDCISCVVTEERNGIYTLEMKYKLNGYLSEYLLEENIIKARASYKWDNQRFYIKSVKETNSYISVYAEHEIYKVNENQIQPNNGVSNRTAKVTLQQWKNILIDENDFQVHSDITTLNSAFWDIDEYENAKEVLSGKKGSILDIWGGEYEFDNNKIYLWKARGGEIYTPVAYGRNIIDREQERNIENTFTTIYPYAKYQKKDSSGNVVEGAFNVVTVPGYYIDSDLAKNFKTRKIQKVDFSQEETKKDSSGNPLPLTPAELKNLALSYMKSNNFGVPKIHIEVSFIDLAKNSVNIGENTMEQYNLCDLVPVWLTKQNIQVKAKVIKTEWNVLTSSYDTLTLGEAKDDFRVAFNNIAYTTVNQAVKKSTEGIVTQVVEITEELSKVTEETKNKVEAVSIALNNINLDVDNKINAKSTVYRNENTPVTKNTGDLWIKPKDGFYELYQYDSELVEWEYLINTKNTTDADISELKKLVADLESNLTTKINNAQSTADSAETKSNKAYNIATDALEISEGNSTGISELTKLIGNSAETLEQIERIIEMLGADPDGNLVLEVEQLKEKSRNFVKNIQIEADTLKVWLSKDEVTPSITLKLPKSFSGNFEDLRNIPDLVTFSNARKLETVGIGGHIAYVTDYGTVMRRR